MLHTRLTIVSATLALAACSTKPASRLAAGPAKSLSTAFDSACAGCHGDHGEGGLGPVLAKSALTLAQFTEIVRTGAGPMPAFDAASYSDAQIAADYAALTGK